MKNKQNSYMEKVAEILGVKLNEEFKIKGHGKTTFKMTKNGLAWYDENDDSWDIYDYTNLILIELLNGETEIESKS